MKTRLQFGKTIVWIICAAAFVMRGGAFAADSTEPGAVITDVRLEGTNVVVEVQASAGFTRVTLESSPRVGRRSWEPRAVRHLESTGAGIVTFTFSVPMNPAMEILRVRGDLGETLPATFFSGTNSFVSGSGQGGTIAETGMGPGDLFNAAPTEDGRESGGDSRAVVESDIWKLDGDTLYFFNQYRGLQVIHVANPDAPVVKGTYDLAAAGEQMYVMDSARVVLLARDTCSWYGGTSESKVVLLDASEGSPLLVAELAVKGYIVESRMVGTALYLVANSYREVAVPTSDASTQVTWEWGSQIYSFDLSNFNAPVARSSDWVTGYNNVIMATDRFLLVAQYQYVSNEDRGSLIHIYDISAPNGTFEKLSSIRALGTVADKFKMSIDGKVMSVVSQQEFLTTRWNIATMLQNFSLDDPRKPTELGRLKIIENEQLHATRFAGKLLYAVTFMRIDPLWIIDLSDPATPRKVGELEIPGWSTYIHPLPGKLLTIGIDTTNGWRTAVQLFNVQDPSNPSLMSKVFIGDSWSSSEANQDEKAFGVLPEEKLVLVPFHGSHEGEWISGVQLIDLEPDRLVKRGVIEQEFGARRATMHRERVLSISARELLTVDATNRDEPRVVSTLELSWATDQVHLAGDYLLEIDSYSGGTPAVRVVRANDSSTQLAKLNLTNVPYLGSTVRGSELHLLQGRSRQLIWPETYNPTNYYPIKTNPGVLIASVYDLARLPEVRLLSQTLKENDGMDFYGAYDPVWVEDDLIVWANGGGYAFRCFWCPMPMVDVGGPVSGGIVADSRAAPDSLWWYPYWGGGAGHFVAVDVSGDTPEIASTVTLRTTNGWWSFGKSFTAKGLVYTSHHASEYDADFDPPPYTYQTYDDSKYVTKTNDPPPGAWVQRYYLDVIDFSDPRDPLARRPANIPGTLIGLHRGGEVLYTRGDDAGGIYYWTGGMEKISASAYDGVEARLLDSMTLTNGWPKPALSDGGYIYLGEPPPTNGAPGSLGVWTLNANGKFTLAESVQLEQAASTLAKYGDLLAVQTEKIELYNASDPAALTKIGSGTTQSCYGVMLDNGDGAVDRGLWLPLGWYGVVKIPINPAPGPVSPGG